MPYQSCNFKWHKVESLKGIVSKINVFSKESRDEEFHYVVLGFGFFIEFD